MTWIINWAIQGALKCFRSRCKQINKLPKKDLRPRTTWSISNSRLKWCFQKLMNLLRGKACSITRIRRRSGPRRSYIIWLTKSTRIRRLAISNVISKKGNWQVSNNDRSQPTWEAQIRSNIKTKVTFWARQVLCHLKMPAKKFLKWKRPNVGQWINFVVFRNSQKWLRQRCDSRKARQQTIDDLKRRALSWNSIGQNRTRRKISC